MHDSNHMQGDIGNEYGRLPIYLGLLFMTILSAFFLLPILF